MTLDDVGDLAVAVIVAAGWVTILVLAISGAL